MNTKSLYDNIMEHKQKHRLRGDEMDKALGLKTNGFNSKMNRLKLGSRSVVSVGDLARLIKLFGCTANALMKDTVKDSK